MHQQQQQQQHSHPKLIDEPKPWQPLSSFVSQLLEAQTVIDYKPAAIGTRSVKKSAHGGK
jgi:beta-galactosidase/beta-glucuronidase